MSPMARSFWAENRKVASLKTKAALGIGWLYPTYRARLRAILSEEGEGRPVSAASVSASSPIGQNARAEWLANHGLELTPCQFGPKLQ